MALLPDYHVFMKLRHAALAFWFTALLAFGQSANTSIDKQQLIQPEELAKTLQSGHKPVVLYIGPRMFYTQAHIPGAEDMGPAARPEGMDKLRQRARSLPHDASVIIYCGCCPWEHCPNIRPAYDELSKMGFTRLKVLYLATSFGKDWADKGYPVAKGD